MDLYHGLGWVVVLPGLWVMEAFVGLYVFFLAEAYRVDIMVFFLAFSFPFPFYFP
jgi:hypothetical protein